MFFYVKNIYNTLKINKILRGLALSFGLRVLSCPNSKRVTQNSKHIIRRLKPLCGSCQTDFFVRKRIA